MKLGSYMASGNSPAEENLGDFRLKTKRTARKRGSRAGEGPARGLPAEAYKSAVPSAMPAPSRKCGHYLLPLLPPSPGLKSRLGFLDTSPLEQVLKVVLLELTLI